MNSWDMLLKQIEPEIEILRALGTDLDIKIIVRAKGNILHLYATSNFFSGEHKLTESMSSDFYDPIPKIEWIHTQLNYRTDVEQIEKYSWKFDNIKELEKFITLYNIAWA